MKRLFLFLTLTAALLCVEARPSLFGDAVQYFQGAFSSPADAFAQCVRSGLSIEVCREKIKEAFHTIVPIFY